MILVTGATGNVGGHLIRHLCEAGSPVRAMVRTQEKADTLRGYDCEIVLGSFEDSRSLHKALVDVDAVFLLSPAGPRMAEQETAVLAELGHTHGTPRVVKLAAAGVDNPALQGRFLDQHRRVVERMRADGIRHTVLAPTSFMQNLVLNAASIQETGTFFAPAGDAAISHVDVRDVADVAAHVLTTEGHDGRTYTVTGPEALTYEQVAERLSALLGREIRYVDVPPEKARAGMLESGLPEWLVDGLLELNVTYKAGAAAVVTDEVQKATGRPPRSIDDFLADHRMVFL
ncbi:MAG: hypothetical protein JWN35_3122 [Frankiales bacterium]|nr:hypothetical protein [Frankiales bacterium]